MTALRVCVLAAVAGVAAAARGVPEVARAPVAAFEAGELSLEQSPASAADGFECSLCVQVAEQSLDALVQLAKATQRATRAGRVAYEPGDGCGSRTCCTGIYHKGRWEANQAALHAEVREGTLCVQHLY